MEYLQLILKWLSENFLPTFLATAAIAAGGWFKRKKIKARILNRYYYMTNKTMTASVKSVYTYPVPDQGPINIRFSSEMCNRISENIDKAVTQPDWGKDWATFKIEDISTKVKVRFEPQMNRSLHNPDSDPTNSGENISGYKLVVETQGDLYFGYKEMFPIINFKTFSDRTEEVIKAEYLSTETADTTRVQVKLMQGVPEGIDEINDEKLNIRGQVRDSTLDLTFRTPENLQQGLRKYFNAS